MKNHPEGSISYDYRFRGWSLLFAGFSLLLFSAAMIFLAIIDPDSFIGFPSPYGMGRLLYIASAISLALLLAMLLKRARDQKTSCRTIYFDKHELTLPKSLYSNTRLTIPYSAITGIELQSLRRSASQSIVINYGDQSVLISDLGFETKTEFRAVHCQLEQRLSGASGS
ncbi:MAG: hypothetical protein N4A65_03900 [Cohaesibacter sp.]|jgi:hypothetical protein|nr:hypothetical protein [Cohaesibacter sp.]